MFCAENLKVYLCRVDGLKWTLRKTLVFIVWQREMNFNQHTLSVPFHSRSIVLLINAAVFTDSGTTRSTASCSTPRDKTHTFLRETCGLNQLPLTDAARLHPSSSRAFTWTYVLHIPQSDGALLACSKHTDTWYPSYRSNKWCFCLHWLIGFVSLR